MPQALKTLLFVLLLSLGQLAKAQEVEVVYPEIIVSDIAFDIIVKSDGSDTLNIELGESVSAKKTSAEDLVISTMASNGKVPELKVNGKLYPTEKRAIPLWFGIVPPLVAIVLALIFKEVVSSLLFGILSGALVSGFYSGGFWSGVAGFFKVSGHYIISALNDTGHLSVIVFSILIGGIVTVISKNGGMSAMVQGISRKATNPKKGQLATYFLGIAIFFDDYANTLVVGNTMRPITDKLKISREKLAYLVDSTAAPVAAIAFVTTWIGAELGYIKDGLNSVALSPELSDLTPYAIFLNSLSYSFYPILTLLFMFFLIKSGKDFGPMLKAERRARNDEGDTQEAEKVSAAELEHFTAKEGIKKSGWFAIVPIIIIVFGTLAGLLITGYSAENWANPEMGFWRKLSNNIGNSDSYQALLWSSFSALVVAIAMSVAGKKLSLNESVEAAVNGFKGMLDAVIILILAWSLAEITEELHTAEFLTGLLSGNISIAWIPAITFVLSAVVAFSTGSSWGTMAIMYPLCIPALLNIGMSEGLGPDHFLPVLYNGVACVLAGAVLGDHCSPISDTTILSSLATRCNHIAHVKTQLPYALTVGACALLIGIIPAAFGVPAWLCFLLAVLSLLLITKFVAKEVEA